MKLPGFFAEASLYWSTKEYRMTGTSSEASEAVYRQQSCNGPDRGLCNGTFTDLTSDQSCGRFADVYDSEQMAVVPAFDACPGQKRRYCYYTRGIQSCFCECPAGTFSVGPKSDVCFPIPCRGGKIRVFVSPFLAVCKCPPGTKENENGTCTCPPGTMTMPDGTCLCPGGGGLMLENGKCVCPVGKKRCPQGDVNAPCVDTNEDRDNCGGCGKKCEPGQECIKGKCSPRPCGPGQVLVNGQCVGHPPPCRYNEPTQCSDGHGGIVCGCFCNCNPVKTATCTNNTAPAFCP
jgi:hypothetical protein